MPDLAAPPQPAAEPSAPSHSVQLIRSTAEFEDFVTAWTALWHADRNRTPFQHPAWLVPWWHQFGQPGLFAVVVRHSERPVALLPFYLLQQDRAAEDTAVVADPGKLLLIGAGTSDYLDGVFHPDCTAADVIAGLQVLRAAAGPAVLDVMQLRPASLLAEALRALGAMEGTAEPTSAMPASRLADLPTPIRRNAMYYRNRAARDATLVLRCSTAQTALEDFDTLVRLHGERWRERGETGVLDDPAVLAWHREALPALARAGLLRLVTLARNDEPIGIMYALADDAAKPDGSAATIGGGQTGRCLYLYLPAFSVEHREFRPGTVLLAVLIDAAAAEGFTTVDMLRGGESYKQLWHVSEQQTLSFSLGPEHQ